MFIRDHGGHAQRPPRGDHGPLDNFTNQDQVSAFLEEVEVEKPEDAALALHPGLVVLEVKGVDARLCVGAGEVETTLAGAAR